MTKKLFIFFFLIMSAIVVCYIDYGIRNHDIRFYSGKDTGYFIRIESIIVLNSVFYILNGLMERRRIFNIIVLGLAGAIIAIAFSIFCYIFIPSDYYGLTFHIITLVLCYLSYFGILKIKQLLTANNHH